LIMRGRKRKERQEGKRGKAIFAICVTSWSWGNRQSGRGGEKGRGEKGGTDVTVCHSHWVLKHGGERIEYKRGRSEEGGKKRKREEEGGNARDNYLLPSLR